MRTHDYRRPAESNMDDDDADFQRLNLLNRVICVLFVAVSAFFFASTANSSAGTVPITAVWWRRRGEAGEQPFEMHAATPITIKVGYLSASFCTLAAVDHFAVGWWMRGAYESCVRAGQNPFRWTEYVFSASLMNVMVAMLCGVLDAQLLFTVAMLTGTTMLFGALGDGSRSTQAFWLGCIPFAGAWAIILAAFLTAAASSSMPAFVYAIIVALLALECCFAANQVRASVYMKRELVFILLSPTAKLALAFITYGGVMALPA
jgi:hypothetical protein